MKHVLAIALVAVCSVAQAEGGVTGIQLKADCAGDPPGGLYCMGLAQGIRWGVTLQSLFDGQVGLFCTPEEVTTEQLRDVVSKYLNDHPEELHFRAEPLVVSALAKAFPCSK